MSASVKTIERRCSVRMSHVFQATICDSRWMVLARGRTVDISESGVMVITEDKRTIPRDGKLYLEFIIPTGAAGKGRRNPVRIVRYKCNIARIKKMGPLLGIGLQFVEKIS